MIKLYIFRSTQADTVDEAATDGSLYFVGEFETPHAVCVAKGIIEVTADCMDFGEDIMYVEVAL